jgi:sirohydrochlorin cobaltochelatase
MSLLTSTPGILLLGHGTRDPHGQDEFLALTEKVALALAPQPVEAGFIELAEPAVGDAFCRLVKQGVDQIRVVPLLLFAAGHAKDDIPNAIRQMARHYPALEIDVSPPFGLDERILSLSERRYREAVADRQEIVDEDVYWLLVGRGSSDMSATDELARFAAERARRSSLARFGHCFVAAAQPTLFEGLSTAVSLAPERIVVQPHLLFRGAVLDEVAAAVARCRTQHPHMDWVVTAHLGPEQELVEAVLSHAVLSQIVP